MTRWCPHVQSTLPGSYRLENLSKPLDLSPASPGGSTIQVYTSDFPSVFWCRECSRSPLAGMDPAGALVSNSCDYCSSFTHHFKSRTRGHSLSLLWQRETRESVFTLNKDRLVMKSTCSVGTARVLQGSANTIEHMQELLHIWQHIEMLEESGTATTLLYVGKSGGAPEPFHWSARFVMNREWCKLSSLQATAHLWLINTTTFLMHCLGINAQPTKVSNRINMWTCLKLKN